MKKRKFSGVSLVASILFVTQYFLAFFVYKLPGLSVLQWLGWGIWVLSVIFGIAPIFILRSRGGVAKGQSYVKTTQLVDTSLYAIVRHPQFLSAVGITFFSAVLFPAGQWGTGAGQTWIITETFANWAMFTVSLWVLSIIEDRELARHFGDGYREYAGRVPRIFPN